MPNEFSTVLPFRQVHLDFHTSEAIPGVGSEWNKAHFQAMLNTGHINSITVFAKCHHGWSYYPTEVPLCQTHPHLQPGLDLLGAMIEAAQEIGVQTPVYISVGLDEKLVRTHSQWLRRKPDGSTAWSGWLQAGYHEFCLRSPYLENVIAQTCEIIRRYDFPGLFMDIVGVRDCACQYCTEAMLAQGLDPRNDEHRRIMGRATYLNYTRRLNEAVHAIKPHVRIFHNGGNITRGDRELIHANTHLELESLPTGGWGYDHFPLSARYVQNLGMEYLGMTGKFHTTWGEFGGFKHPNALKYEAALALANGAKMSVGDQMHPVGRLDPATYSLIGAAYAEVEAKEPWCGNVKSVADIGVISLEAVQQSGQRTGLTDTGAVRILQEAHLLYDILDLESDFNRYPVLILPDAIKGGRTLQEKLQTYLSRGGKVMATWESGMDPETGDFLIDFGGKCSGESTYSPEYIVPHFALDHWQPTAFVVYSPAKILSATHGRIMAERHDPYFNRDFTHFCSHQHAPNSPQNAGPVMLGTAQTVYLGFPAFRLYAEKGQTVLREIVVQGIRHLLPHPTLITNLPAQGIQTVMRQEAGHRTIIHLLYASPVQRGQGIQVIEDLVPLHNVQVQLRIEQQPARVYLAPQNIDLDYVVENGYLKVTVPQLLCHQMVVVE